MKYIYFLCMWFALNSQFQIVHAADTIFTKHTIKSPQTEPTINTVPNMVYLHDVDDDGNIDIIASHVSWKKKYIHPYVAWYKGPDFKEEIIIVDNKTVGINSRIYRFVLFDVDQDGKKDLIGQGYQPFHNGNKWYRCPDNPSLPWTEYYDYGVDLKNGHDLLLWDIDNNDQMDLILLDSHSGKIIVKPIPKGDKAKLKWPFYTIARGNGFTHYMSLYDVNGDGFKDIVVGKEEDGGDGIRWYEHPGYDRVRQLWKDHFVVNANFTKAFARDVDQDGDMDFIGTGEYFTLGKGFSLKNILNRILAKLTGENAYFVSARIRKRLHYPSHELFLNKDFGWYERVRGNNYIFHEFDKKDNLNDVIGGHNCELVDVDADGDEDLIVGGVDVKDMTQRFRWYEYMVLKGVVKWVEHPIGITSSEGYKPRHGFYCGEMAWGDIDDDGDIDFVYAGQGSGFLGWFENLTIN